MGRLRNLVLLGALLAAVVVAGAVLASRRSGSSNAVPHRTGVLFDAHLRRGLGAYTEVIHPERISIVADPLGIPRQVARFRVYDGDTGPTDNPRAQIGSSAQIRAGQEVWIGWSTLFPTSFPRYVPGWLTFASTYGPPSDGTGPLTLQVQGGDIRWQRNKTYGWDIPWRMPLIRGRWIDFVVHERLSHSARRGFFELWVNTGGGWRRQRLAGQLRLRMQTMDASNGAGPNQHRLSLYRKRGMFRVVTLYHASHRVGTSFGAVAPHSYG
jgi:hypothetical protein